MTWGVKLRSASTVVCIKNAPPSPAIAEIRTWSLDEFRRGEAQWQDLLGRSSADPLFMSWSWQWSWWRHYGSTLNAELWLLAAYSTSGELVGLAPLHRRRAAHRKPLSAVRLEIIGSTWRHSAGAYSEYLDFIVDGRFRDAFMNALADVALRDRRWSDLIIANTKESSIAARFVRQHLDTRCYVREADPIVAQLTALPESFDHYLKVLHPAVRRKVWNHRSRLGNAQFVTIAPDGIETAFDLLNEFHQRRWGSRLFLGALRDFHLDFARLCAQRGTLRLSVLEVDGNPISIMYNVRVGEAEYNLQSGFDPKALKGASPGYLHFGFCLEQACTSGVREFDFLAGSGRNRDYKQDFLTLKTPLIVLQAIRSVPLAWLYKQYDRRGSRVAGAYIPCIQPLFDYEEPYAGMIAGVLHVVGGL